MDSATDLILDYSLVQVTETGSSVAMEKEGLRCCLDKVLAQGVEITSTATDRHTGVGFLMKKSYPLIKHQYDVRHTSKVSQKVSQRWTKKAEAKNSTLLMDPVHF